MNGRVELVFSKDPNVRKHKDYSGVVVWLEPVSAPLPQLPKPARAEMMQKGKAFSPHVLAITLGTVVNFPNYDPIFHNAFSNYDGQLFDIGLYPPGTTRSIAFRREGVVRVFLQYSSFHERRDRGLEIALFLRFRERWRLSDIQRSRRYLPGACLSRARDGTDAGCFEPNH